MAEDAAPGMSREKFAQTVVERVRGRFPLVKIGRVKAPFSLRVNGQVASLENLYRIFRLRPDDLQHQIERWAVELLRVSEGAPDRDAGLDEVGERLLPMVLPCNSSVDPTSIEPPKVSGVGPDGQLDHLATQPLVPGLCVGYVVDGDRTITYVSRKMLELWHTDVDDVHERAMKNLVARSDAMEAHAAKDDEGTVNLILFQTLDGFDASRLLLPNLHERLREHLGSPFIAAVPNRDILLCFRNDADMVASLKDQIRTDYHTMPHQVTEKLVLVTADGIALYQGPVEKE